MTKYSLLPERINVLITGSCGFIGRHLYSRLEKRYNVFCLDYSKKRSFCANNIALDLKNKERVGLFFRNFRKRHSIDIVIHFASLLMPQDKIEDLGVFYDNLKITEGLVELAKILKPKKLINFSSIAVYPNVDGKYSETSPIRPSVNTECLYGLSKFCSENIIDFMLRKENMIIAHLRSSQVYGEGSRSDRIIPLMLEELKRKNVITVFGSGERVSNFIHVDKLTEIVELFIKKDIKGIFNIGDEQLSYLELARRLIKEYGNKDSRIIKERRGSRAKVYIDIGKLKKVLQ